MGTTPRGALALTFTREQARQLIAALALRPFGEVFALIGQLHAGTQVAVTPEQLRLLLLALRAMPGDQAGEVGAILRSIHGQMRACQERAR
jgi:hypothetical protein